MNHKAPITNPDTYYVVASKRPHGTEWLSVVGDQYSPGVWADSPEAAVKFPTRESARKVAAIKGGMGDVVVRKVVAA